VCFRFLYRMNRGRARFVRRHTCRSRSGERARRESTSTTRATKRDRPRADRSTLSPRIRHFARQLEHCHSASSTAWNENPGGATTEPTAQPVMSNADVAEPSTPPLSRECREQSATVARRTASHPPGIDNRRRVCEACGEIIYTRNWTRHIRRCHAGAVMEQPGGTVGEMEPGLVATAKQGSNRPSRVDMVSARSRIRRCVNLVYPLQCLNVPLSVQLSCAKQRWSGCRVMIAGPVSPQSVLSCPK